MINREEVLKHATRESCWVIIQDNAYDVTEIIDSHPGGSNAILRYAGQDATRAFQPLHASDTLLKHMSPRQHLGPVEKLKAATTISMSVVETETREQKLKRELRTIINISDFESAAARHLPRRAFAFYKAAADDEFTAQWNRDSWRAVRFWPRVLRPVDVVDTSTTILSHKFSAPFFICPAGGPKLAHPEGETILTKAAGRHAILHWVCNMAGCTQEEIVAAKQPAQPLYWQIYALNDLATTKREVEKAISLGFTGFALTVDAVRAGKRERDTRAMLAETLHDDMTSEEDEDDSFSKGPTVQRGMMWSSFDWPTAIKWLRDLTNLPIAIKGIQSWEDAELCMHYGVHPWLSNHAGRQLEGAPSSLETLIEIRNHCPTVIEKCEIIVDGGVTRGTDIVKALALGAKAVGLGRGFLFPLVYGESGVNKAIRILKHEMETAMALLGVSEIGQLNELYVNTAGLARDSGIPRPHL